MRHHDIDLRPNGLATKGKFVDWCSGPLSSKFLGSPKEQGPRRANGRAHWLESD